MMAVASVVDLARELSPHLTRDRSAAEDAAGMTDAVRAVAGPAGMFRLLAPREVGGLELSLPEFYDVIEELAAADPTVAWHATNSSATCRLTGMLGEAERAELFRELDYPYGWAVAPSGRAVCYRRRLPAVRPMGIRDRDQPCALVRPGRSGRTRTVGVRRRAAPPDARMFFVRRADLEVHPTFRDATAMRGTGSNAASVEDLFVPGGFVVRITDPPQVDRPLYRLPPFAHVMTTCGAMGIGFVRSALAGSIELMGRKNSSMTGAGHYDQPPVKGTIADADAEVRALRAGMRDCTAELWDAVMHTPEVDLPTRARLYASGIHTLNRSRSIVSDLYVSSSSVVYAGRNPVERSLRDAHALAAAIQGAPFAGVRLAAGRVLLGHEPDGVPFF